MVEVEVGDQDGRFPGMIVGNSQKHHYPNQEAG